MLRRKIKQGRGIGNIGGRIEILDRMSREGITEKEISEFISKGSKGTPCGCLEEERRRLIQAEGLASAKTLVSLTNEEGQ